MDNNQGIAIVGLGGVFPGANDTESYWESILAARDCSREAPSGRWLLDTDDVYQPGGPAPDRVYSKRACFVEDFRPDFQGLTIDEDYVAGLDPMFHLLLHAGNQAWRSAQMDEVDRQRTGIVIGNIALPTDAASALADECILPLVEKQVLGRVATKSLTAKDNRYVAGLPATLLARALGLGSGAWTLDAACASSLYALKYAIDELLAGRSDAMLCGGVSRPDSLYTQMGFSALHALSASGHCSPFDEKGDGLVVGEGAGILVVKRLEDALAHGDHIYATVAGIGLSNDIRGNLMSPDTEGQLRAMRAAYARAGWQPQDVDLIECHGTGTPVGDVVEFNSLCTLWGEQRRADDCVIGSVKSNVGHLLTAAGAAGLVKVLLAMQAKTLPPTANFSRAAKGMDLAGSPFTVLSEGKTWPRRDADTPRRAAVSAFGFGGINAHVLLEEWCPEQSGPGKVSRIKARQEAEAVAIVGLDACFGPWRDLQSVRQRLFGLDKDAAQPLVNSWGIDTDLQGYCLEHIDFPLGRFRIPPNELRAMLPQQLLMLRVAARAIDDAGIALPGSELFRNAGVYVGIGLDLGTTNFHLRWQMLPKARAWTAELGLELDEEALQQWVDELRDSLWPAMDANRTMGGLGGIVASRIARAFSIGGPSFTVSSEDSSAMHALQTAVRSLQRGEIELAISGGVDIASDPRVWPLQGPVGEGAAALVLKRQSDALADGDRIYALVRGIGTATLAPGDPEAERRAIESSLVEAGARSERISLHVSAQGKGEVFAQILAGTERKLPCAHLDSRAQLGACGAAAGMVSLLGASLGLHHQLVPAAEKSNTGNSDGVYTARKAHYWLRDREDGPRQALVSSEGQDGNQVHAVLEGVEQTLAVDPPAMPKSETLFSLCGKDHYEIIDRVQALRAMAAEQSGLSIQQLARQWWAGQKQRQDQPLALSILAESSAELASLLKQAQAKLEGNHSFRTEKMFYSASPLGERGKVAFVFPGSGSHFIGMGEEMSARWPKVLNALDQENAALASQFAACRFWSRENTRGFSHADYIFGQVWLGTMVSDVIASFGVRPDAVIGYCLGETVGLFASRSWRDRDLMLKRMQATRLFSHELGGDCEAVKATWGLAADERVDWQLGVLDRPAETVRQVLAGWERVYLMIINTPEECVIGGERQAVQAVVGELACNFHPLEGVTTVHCEVVEQVEQAYRELHLFETTPPQGVSFYSGVAGSHYMLTRESAAESITQQALQTFDYTRLVNAAWEDGVRIFIEMGPGASCSRMIGQILGEREHIARSACVAGQSDVANVLRILAVLNTERVAVDLASLYEAETEQGEDEDVQMLRLPVGREALGMPLPEQRTRPVNIDSERASPRSQVISDKENATLDADKVVVYPGVDSGVHMLSAMIEQMAATEGVKAEVEEAFLRVANGINAAMGQAISTQMQLLQQAAGSGNSTLLSAVESPVQQAAVAFDRDMCLEFATGSVARMLGPRFAEVDTFPTRVRLPDEPLMLVDRIIEVEGEVASMTQGRVVTEHDVRPGAWYLDGGRIPTCIAVEAGQADLFLSGYLGIDLQTRGLAVYRLLDAEVCFHGPLPQAGQTIHYDIHIDQFFRQGDTWLFRFHFDGSVDGQPLITMRNGCAGFFSQAELDAGQGIVLTTLEQKALPGKVSEGWQPPLAMRREAYDDRQLAALRRGDLAGCFGQAFEQLRLEQAMGLPKGRMTLVHRILDLDPQGGRFGLGIITGEADIHEDDWFLTCHFVDDQVMPGTLMYECCLHTLRVYLLRLGWVGEVGEFVYEPLTGVSGKLKCRGQVLASTRKVQYEISIKEIGYRDDGTPYVIADALMSADGRAIVQMGDMSLQLSGLTRRAIKTRWQNAGKGLPVSRHQARPPIFDYASINAFAVGKPSEAFGERYRMFDEERVIARLPGPPFQFLDRIVAIEGCEQWVLKAGGTIKAEYDVPADAWYFAADRQPRMPFSVLLEIALQPCGWLAAYLGSALTSDVDMSFRNLGGKARQLQAVDADCGTLSTTVTITNVAVSGGMIIQNFDFAVANNRGPVYEGDTYFGFFSRAALADQVGIRDAEPFEPGEQALVRTRCFRYPQQAPFPDRQMRMVQEVSVFDPGGGPCGLGFIRGTAEVDPEAWFFKAHFHQDPVWPGSLGLESFLQLLKLVAQERWEGGDDSIFQCMALDAEHSWVYRGQIIPADRLVTVQASISAVNDAEKTLQADGFLSVDDRIIYQMTDFTLKMSSP